MPPKHELLTDDYVAEVLAKEAADCSLKYSAMGLEAFNQPTKYVPHCLHHGRHVCLLTTTTLGVQRTSPSPTPASSTPSFETRPATTAPCSPRKPPTRPSASAVSSAPKRRSACPSKIGRRDSGPARQIRGSVCSATSLPSSVTRLRGASSTTAPTALPGHDLQRRRRHRTRRKS